MATKSNIATETRFAVVNVPHQEVMTANHILIGEAFNSIVECYNSPKGLVVVATLNDKILGEVNRAGVLKKNRITLPATIRDGGKHPYFDPEIAKKVTETGRQLLANMAPLFNTNTDSVVK